MVKLRVNPHLAWSLGSFTPETTQLSGDSSVFVKLAICGIQHFRTELSIFIHLREHLLKREHLLIHVLVSNWNYPFFRTYPFSWAYPLLLQL